MEPLQLKKDMDLHPDTFSHESEHNFPDSLNH